MNANSKQVYDITHNLAEFKYDYLSVVAVILQKSTYVKGQEVSKFSRERNSVIKKINFFN